MLRVASLILCLAFAGLTLGCSTTPAPPADTRAADVQAIKNVEAAWLKDVATKDADKWASYFTEDGSALYPGMPTINGKLPSRRRWLLYSLIPTLP